MWSFAEISRISAGRRRAAVADVSTVFAGKSALVTGGKRQIARRARRAKASRARADGIG
jgi:hypothetical protein